MQDFNVKVFSGSFTDRVRFFKSVFKSREYKKGKKQYDDFGIVTNPFYNPHDPTDSILIHSIDYEEFKHEQSLRCSVSRSRNQVKRIAMSFVPKYFCTFTFAPDKVDRYDYDACVKLFSKFLKSLRQMYDGIQYIVVPEKHKDGAYHFHGLFSEELEVRALYKDSKGVTHYVIPLFSSGRNEATSISSLCRVTNYITKYISKDIATVAAGRRRYWYSYSTINIPVDSSWLINYNDMYRFLNTLCEKGVVYYDCKESPVPYIEINVSDPDIMFCILSFLESHDFSCG